MIEQVWIQFDYPEGFVILGPQKNTATLLVNTKSIGFIFLFALLVACSSSGAQSTDGNSSSRPNIRVKTEGASLDGEVLLVASIGDQQYIVDTGRVEGTVAVFEREVPYSRGVYLAYYPDKTAVQFMMDGDQEFSLSANKDDVAQSMVVEGSASNQLFYDTRRFEMDLQPRIQAANQALNGLQSGSAERAEAQSALDKLLAERKGYMEQLFADNQDNFYARFKRAGQNPEVRKDLVLPDGSPDNEAQVAAYRKDFWTTVDFTDTALLRTPVVFNKLKRYMEELTPRNADAVKESADFLLQQVIDKPLYLRYFANWITLKYEPGKTSLMDGEAVYVHMIRNYFTPELAFWSDSMTIYGLQQRAGEMAQSLKGQPGPNITVNDLNGKPRTLYDEKAPYIMVYLYNPTCEHCIEQTPKVRDFAITRQGEVGLYAIAIDTDEAAWRNFVQEYNMGAFTNVYDPTNRSIYKTYYVDHTPELYLLNPERKIIGKNLKATQVAQVISRDKAERK